MFSRNLLLLRTKHKYRGVRCTTLGQKGMDTSASGKKPFLHWRAWPGREATQKDLHLPQQTGFAIPQRKDIKHLGHIIVLPSTG